MKGNLMRKNFNVLRERLRFTLMLAACGSGVQRKTSENILQRKWNRRIR